MQIIALPFPQLPYGIVERGPQRKEREMKGKKKIKAWRQGSEEGEEIKLLADETDLFSMLGGGSLLEYKTFLPCWQAGCLHDSSGTC